MNNMLVIQPEMDNETNEILLKVTENLPQMYHERFQYFFDFYEVDDLITHPDNVSYLKPKDERVCRFCNLKMPNVTFRKEAHVLPQLMGNKNLISDFECDTCNLELGRYDSELASFIGFSRTLTFLKGQRGLPEFKSPDEVLTIRENKEPGVGKRLNMVWDGADNHDVEIDLENKELTVKAVKPSYVPLNAYKSLLKIGYTLLPEEELANYASVNKVLRSPSFDSKLLGNPFFRVMGALFPGPPLASFQVFCCKKRKERQTANVPTRTFIIYFHNYIYQFFMPFCEADRGIGNEANLIELPSMPPLLDEAWVNEFGKPQLFNIDLSGSEIKKGEVQAVTMSFEEAIIYPDKESS